MQAAQNHPGSDEWFPLLLSDVLCSERVTMRHAAEQTIRSLPGECTTRVLSVVTLTFDL